jgi:23S rRNA pseudouridine955/2504/2580 synthase
VNRNNIPVLYEDEHCIIVNKPAGLACQGGAGETVSLDSLFEERLVHRLDKDTSGIVVLAKGAEEAAFFGKIFEGREAEKTYLALCKEDLTRRRKGAEEKWETINMPLETKGKVQSAETRYRIIDVFPLANAGIGVALLEIRLGTGRMHQIRKHMAAIGMPLLGDDKYGDFKLNKIVRKSKENGGEGIKHLMLHAWKLHISNIDVIAPPPDYWTPFCPESQCSRG